MYMFAVHLSIKSMAYIRGTATRYVVRMYSQTSASQHTFGKGWLDIVWKLFDSHWGLQCETKRSKQNIYIVKASRIHVFRMELTYANSQQNDQNTTPLTAICVTWDATERSKHCTADSYTCHVKCIATCTYHLQSARPI